MVRNFHRIATYSLLVASLAACDDDESPSGFRPSMNYTSLDTAIAYSEQFKDKAGTSTVDLTEGNTLYKMFQGLNYQSTSAVSAETEIDATVLENMFTNTGAPFTDVSTNTISINGNELNTSEISLHDHVAVSLGGAEAEAVRADFQGWFTEIATASESVTQDASKGTAGKLGNFLVDGKGIELAQVIQKSLIGALQLDYIGNVLLEEGLTADNTKLVDGESYTQLEHNWDMAYAMLTLNPIYLRGATDVQRKTTEFGAGSYIWEYNKANYAKIYPAFLRGRAAIVNNDRNELEKQAEFIRTEIEKTIANAALGYLQKWKTNETDASRAHAFAEGLGFIYSLRFAKIHDSDTEFSEHLIEELIGGEFGFWDLTSTAVTHAEEEIREKFNL